MFEYLSSFCFVLFCFPVKFGPENVTYDGWWFFVKSETETFFLFFLFLAKSVPDV